MSERSGFPPAREPDFFVADQPRLVWSAVGRDTPRHTRFGSTPNLRRLLTVLPSKTLTGRSSSAETSMVAPQATRPTRLPLLPRQPASAMETSRLNGRAKEVLRGVPLPTALQTSLQQWIFRRLQWNRGRPLASLPGSLGASAAVTSNAIPQAQNGPWQKNHRHPGGRRW